MYNFLRKYKSQFIVLLKWVIVLGAIYFIYKKLTSDNSISLNQFKEQFAILSSKTIWQLLALLLFTDLNWLLEIFKWKKLASVEKKLSFLEAFEQCLASHTASIITPNKIGEYGAKALFFEKEKRKKIMTLNLIGNFSQLIATIIFGIIGLVFVFTKQTISFPNFSVSYSKLWLVIGFISGLILLQSWVRNAFKKIVNYVSKISNSILFEVIFISFLRYLVFSHQFYFILILLNINVDYQIAMPIIFSMYLLASIIPSLTIFDWLIKGSIAVWLFSFIGIEAVPILMTTTLMWILNFAIPALIGSGFVLNFKLPKE